MVPTAQTAREGKYETTGGVVKFAVGQSGSIVFLAPITMSLPPGRYTPRARLERDDPPNGHPSLLGTNIQLRRRSAAGSAGVENVLVIAAGQGASLLLGGNGIYTVDGPGRDFNAGIDVEKHFYWLQVEIKQQTPTTAQTRNAVIGLLLL
jgi:hypothetical protein